jgi:hypothetical protein
MVCSPTAMHGMRNLKAVLSNNKTTQQRHVSYFATSTASAAISPQLLLSLLARATSRRLPTATGGARLTCLDAQDRKAPCVAQLRVLCAASIAVLRLHCP